jgi:hypothetical protein
MNIVNTILERVRVLMDDMAFVWGKIDELSEWDSLAEIKSNWNLLMELATRAVVCVEATSADIRKELQVIATSEEKRKAAVAYIDTWIKLPPYLEWMDNMVIGYVVDTTVGALNRKYGKDWGVTSRSRAVEIVRENAGK